LGRFERRGLNDVFEEGFIRGRIVEGILLREGVLISAFPVILILKLISTLIPPKF